LVDIVYAKKKVVKGQREVYRDYTVEQGIGYKYAIQRYNDNGIRSTMTEPQEIFADFEHMYLFDGEK
jgi:hypothetical protein